MKCLFTNLFILVFCNLLSAQPSNRSFSFPAGITQDDFLKNEIVIKLKPEYRQFALENEIKIPSITNELNAIGVSVIKKKFPRHNIPVHRVNENGFALTDLSLIYSVKFNRNISVEKVLTMLLHHKEIDYAEPLYIYKPLYVPNDTLATYQYQYFHKNIKTFEGWDIQKGDTNIVIGITDTGIDTIHTELINQIKYNYADPINGIDDDGDGYIDNFRGWNVAFDNNDVQGNVPLHGNFVAGIAAAETDNVTGIAGVGFHTKFLPVRCAPNSNVIVNGDDAIVYAADHGCSVINCSWGGFGRSQYSQDIINYATINKNALVVASAGNANNDAPFYPASYQYVLSVAGTDSSDIKWTSSPTSGSSYGSYVDVSAPGDKIFSIFPTGSVPAYWYSGGTSESAPQVSAIAALVKAQFPTLNALQIGERIRATSDNIDTIPGNAAYVNKLGKGRVNLFRALTEPAQSVRAFDTYITDNNDDAYVANDTVRISSRFTNLLDAVSNLSVTVSCNSPDITLLNNTFSIGSLSSMQSDSNRTNPFEAIILPTIPLNSKVIFTYTFSANGYTDTQQFELTVNVDYLNVLVNDIGISITSKGRLGYNDASGSQGIGFTQNESESLLYMGSLMIGVNDSMSSDAVVGMPAGSTNQDFTAIDFIHEINPPIVSDYDLTTRFDDSGNSLPLGVEVQHNTYAWSTTADRKYVMVEYIIKNNSNTDYQDLYAGIYCDWDITANTYATNRALFDSTNRMGYAYEVTSNTNYAGIKLLTPGNVKYYAFNNDGSDGSISIYDGFSRQEKYQCMSGAGRFEAGMTGNGSDVSMLLSSGPFSVTAGDSVKVAFALVGGDNLTDITDAAVAAQIKYNSVGIAEVNTENLKIAIYPNPADNYFTLSMESENPQTGIIQISDITGRIICNKPFSAANQQQLHFTTEVMSSGIYLVHIITPASQYHCKLIVR